MQIRRSTAHAEIPAKNNILSVLVLEHAGELCIFVLKKKGRGWKAPSTLEVYLFN